MMRVWGWHHDPLVPLVEMRLELEMPVADDDTDVKEISEGKTP
jgi:hypothetical protein